MSFDPLISTPRPEDHAYACYAVLLARDRFAYLHGPTDACRQALADLPASEYLFRQGCDTPDRAQAACETAAAGLGGSYDGQIVAQAVHLSGFSALRERWNDERSRVGKPSPGGGT